MKKTNRVTYCVFSHKTYLEAKRENDIVIKCCTGIEVANIITHANIFDSRFWTVERSGSRICLFSIDWRCRLYHRVMYLYNLG